MPTSPTSPFPLYLLPSIPFRRRRSSATSTSTTHTASPSSSPPQPTSFLSRRTSSQLRCQKCLTDLIPTESIISKGFTGRHGRAYLVGAPCAAARSGFLSGGGLETSNWAAGDIPNTFTHKPVPRQLVTGAHTVSDISCRSCGTVLGWKYVDAAEDTQKYKVGKFILETKRVVKSVGLEDLDEGDEAAGGVGSGGGGGGGRGGSGIDGHAHRTGAAAPAPDEIEFDSQDEDECEDLFSGIWSQKLARSRRRSRGV